MEMVTPAFSVRSATWPAHTRIDTVQLRQRYPIVGVVTRYGVELRRSGASFTGRCPFHADGGRPNLVVFPRSGRWSCFRCGAHGDSITFVQEVEHLSFREAAIRLGADAPRSIFNRSLPPRPPVPVRAAETGRGTTDYDVLDAAVELYANRLLADDQALAYMARRGFPRELLERERVGYAAGTELVPYLIWRHLPLDTARRSGLLRTDGREFLAGRIVFPEIRAGRVIWLIGRLLEQPDSSQPVPAGPRYLGLPGRKPLLGWDAANRDLRGVCLVEGPTDLLMLRYWGVPALALCGTYLAQAALELLGRWARLYLVLDGDAAGQEATARMMHALGDRAIPVKLPVGIKDPADLASHLDGAELFRLAIRQAVHRYRGRPGAGLDDHRL
jgi:DNA primase